jgi:hypothetical protein
MVHVIRILPLAMLLVTASVVVWRGLDDTAGKAKSKLRKPAESRGWKFWR